MIYAFFMEILLNFSMGKNAIASCKQLSVWEKLLYSL